MSYVSSERYVDQQQSKHWDCEAKNSKGEGFGDGRLATFAEVKVLVTEVWEIRAFIWDKSVMSAYWVSQNHSLVFFSGKYVHLNLYADDFLLLPHIAAPSLSGARL